MPRKYLSLLIVVLCFDCLYVQAQQNDYLRALQKEKLSEENRTAVQERIDAVKLELETLKGHPWAGIYWEGGGLGANRLLVIAPKSGFAYTWRSGDVISDRQVDGKTVTEMSLGDQNYGDVVWENGRVKLSPVLSRATSLGALSTEFYPIPWDKQIYLVPTDKIIDFCNNVNRVHPNYIGVFGDFFSRNTQEIPQLPTEKPTGKPEVPEEFKSFLLENPVDGEVIAVGETQEVRKRMYGSMEMNVLETVLTINRGSRDGLLPGMEFVKTQKTEKSARIFVISLTKVTETEAEGILTRNLDENPPQIGWPVSTCVRW